MNPRIIVLFFIAVAALTCRAHASEDVLVTTLPNGMKVIVREGHAVNLVAVDVWIHAGSAEESEGANGVAHFVEHMIFKATSKRGPGEIDREIEGLGAEINGGTSRDYSHFYTTVASEYLPTALDVIADAVMNAQFRPEDIEKERRVLLDEIARSEGNPVQRALDIFARTAFESHPYRLSPTGARDVIGKLTRDELLLHHNRFFTPENITVVIAGDVSKTEAVALVEKAFAGFARTSRVPRVEPPPEPPLTSPRVTKLDSPGKDAYLVVGYLAPGADRVRDVCALDVILAVLGDAHEGRIYSALTAKGIGFNDIETDFVTQKRQSTFAALVRVDPKDADAARDVLLAEYRRLGDEPLSDAELQHAKRLVEGGDLFDQETFAGQARALGLYDCIATYDLALKYGGIVQSLTASDIMDAAERYFGANDYIILRMEPR